METAWRAAPGYGGRIVGPTIPTTLPRPDGLLIGRDTIVRALADRLRRPGALVTLTGPGGVGKTRVAVAAAALTGLPVAFLRLAGVAPGGFRSALAGALAPAAAGLDQMDAVCDVLADGPHLLVLDTFEHLTADADLVATLAHRCPELCLLVTSRSRLRLGGETVVRLDPLSSEAAVTLLVERARAVGTEVDETDPCLAAVCDRLDRLPLAIELVAARTTLLSLPDLLARLQDERPGTLLGLLGRGRVDVELRHRSMRGALWWSYDLLAPEAQAALRELSVFPASFDLDGAEAVCTADVIDTLSELVDLHLVTPVPHITPGARFVLLDPIREFARELLGLRGDEPAAAGRLLAWTAVLGGAAGTGLRGPYEQDWLDRVAADLSTFRWALRTLLAEGRARDGVRLASALAPYWVHRGPHSEGAGWIVELLGLSGAADVNPVERAVAASWAGRLSAETNDLSHLEVLRAARSTIVRGGGSFDEVALATENLAYALSLAGQLDEAIDLGTEGIALARAAGSSYWLAVFLHSRAMSAERRGDNELAVRLDEETVEVAAPIGFTRLHARAQDLLVRLRLPVIDPADAEAAYQPIMRSFHRCGDLRGVSTCLVNLGVVWTGSDPTLAARWYLAAIEEAHRIGYWHGEAYSVVGIAIAAVSAGLREDAELLDQRLGAYRSTLAAGLPAWAVDAYEASVGPLRRDPPGEGDPADGIGDVQGRRLWRTVRDAARLVAARLGADAPATVAGVVATTVATAEVPAYEPADGWADVPADGPAVARLPLGPARPLGRSSAPQPDHTTKGSPAHAVPRRRGPHLNTELSGREQEILEAIATGRTNKEIAAAFGLSAKTVMHHSGSIYRKLGVRGRAEAIALVYQRRAVPPSAHLPPDGETAVRRR